MDYVRKLPLLIALLSSVIVGLVGRLQRVPDKENMLRMIIVMVIFYSLGLLIRGTIVDIKNSIDKKRAEEEEQARALLEAEKKQNEQNNNEQEDMNSGNILDLKVDDDLVFGTDDEDFDALPVADFIKKELNQ